MYIQSEILKRLDLDKVARTTLPRKLDHFPALIIDRCVSQAASAVVSHISSVYASGTKIPAETITMPRKGFGPRPIRLTTPSGRILYTALTDAISSALPAPTRASGNWDKHRRFGLEGGENYIVDLDIAACYEYIDHRTLEAELVLRSMDLPVCEAINSYLGEVMSQARGLPQMLNASDRLADTYLSILDRQLQRQRYPSSRYVDDIRIIAKSWEEANTTIEKVAEYIRELGLTLSPEKTLVYKQSTLVDQDREDADFFNEHFATAKASLTQIIFVGGLYEDGKAVEIEPEDKEAAQVAARDILYKWQAAVKGSNTETVPLGPLLRFINLGLTTLYDAPQRLPDELLSDIVFEYPSKTEQVVRYLISRRTETLWSEHMESINALTVMGRQSPWSKLWLLSAVEELDPVSIERPAGLTNWLIRQLSDRHEVVRAEAAWVCSTVGLLTSEAASKLYKYASPITQPALAAAVSRQNGITDSIKRGICDDSPLNREAAKWVEATVT